MSDMMVRDTPMAPSELELISLGDGAWRLCDGDLDPHDPARLIAFLEETPRGVEITWLDGRPATGAEIVADLDAALRVVRGA